MCPLSATFSQFGHPIIWPEHTLSQPEFERQSRIFGFRTCRRLRLSLQCSALFQHNISQKCMIDVLQYMSILKGTTNLPTEHERCHKALQKSHKERTSANRTQDALHTWYFKCQSQRSCQTFSVTVMQRGTSSSLIWLMQEVTAPKLKHLALEINDFGVEDRLDACYDSKHFKTADLFQSLMIDWASSGGVRQQAGNNIEVVLPAANMNGPHPQNWPYRETESGCRSTQTLSNICPPCKSSDSEIWYLNQPCCCSLLLP